MALLPASRLFSRSSLRTEAGLSTTSPAAIWLISRSGRRAMVGMPGLSQIGPACVLFGGCGDYREPRCLRDIAKKGARLAPHFAVVCCSEGWGGPRQGLPSDTARTGQMSLTVRIGLLGTVNLISQLSEPICAVSTCRAKPNR